MKETWWTMLTEFGTNVLQSRNANR